MASSKSYSLAIALFLQWNFCCSQWSSSFSSPSTSSQNNLVSLSPDTDNTFQSNLSAFATSIYSQLSDTNSGNLILSPISIESVLALLMVSAEKHTYTVLQNGLYLGIASKDTVANEFQTILQPAQNNSQLTMANGIYIQQGHNLRPTFCQMARQQFYANVSNINFKQQKAAASVLNNWVSQETHGKITDVFSSKSMKGDIMVLVNAIYFEGNWQVPFDKRRTYKQTFNYGECDRTNATQENIKMMHNEAYLNYGNISGLNAEVLELSYKDSNINMLIVLPWSCNGLQDVENLWSKFDLSRLSQHMNGAAYKVVLTLPKFSIHSTFNLKAPLKKMGMRNIFNCSSANFDGMFLPRSSSSSSEVNICVSQVIHKAMIDVTETGSVAAAVTFVRGIPGRPPNPGPEQPLPKIIYFTATHPFLFMIRQKESILFMGRFKK